MAQLIKKGRKEELDKNQILSSFESEDNQKSLEKLLELLEQRKK